MQHRGAAGGAWQRRGSEVGLREWFVAMTAHDDVAIGGIALLVRRAASEEEVEFVVEELHNGRALAVTARRYGSSLTTTFGMSIAQVNRVSVNVTWSTTRSATP